MPPDISGPITQLLQAWNDGDAEALDRLMPIVQAELRRIAASYMRKERPDHTLQPMALVNEAYLRLIDQKNIRWQDRAHFLGIAAKMMREILVDHARKKNAAKRRAGTVQVTFDETIASPIEDPLDVVALHEALEKLGTLDERQSRVVELRFFGGLSVKETAEVMGISAATVKREWSTAKAFLYDELAAG